MTIDIVIVHYGDSDTTCAAVGRCTVMDAASVTVVDNSANMPASPSCEVIDPGRNIGFGAAANLGARHGSAPWVLILNPDVELTAATARALVRALELEPQIAALAPPLRYPNGDGQVNGGQFSGWSRELSRCVGAGARLRGLRSRLRPEARPRRGDGPAFARAWVSAAALLVRRAAFEQVGGFDERFFLYYEDEDLCRRLRAAGWRVAVGGAGEAVHEVGGSSGSYQSAHFERSRILYHELHSGPALRRLVTWDASRRIRRMSRLTAR